MEVVGVYVETEIQTPTHIDHDKDREFYETEVRYYCKAKKKIEDRS